MNNKQAGRIMQIALLSAFSIGLIGTGTAYAAPTDAQTPAKTETSETIVPQKFTIDTHGITDAAAMEAVIQAHAGEPHTFEDLQRRTVAITRALRRKGFIVATAYLPEQDFRSGTVRIDIVPGVYDKIIIDNTSHVSDTIIHRELGAVREGAIVRKQSLERAVHLINDLANCEAKTELRAGDESGSTTLVLHVRPKEKPVWGYIGMDNSGYRYTGRYQYAAMVNVANIARDGDLLSVSGMHTGKGQTNGSFAYNIPFGGQGSRIGISFARAQYSLGDVFSSLDANGISNKWSLSWRQNIRRSVRANWWSELRLESKNLHDDIGAQRINGRKHVRNYVLAMNGDFVDTFAGGGENTWEATFTRGKLGLEDNFSKLRDGDKAGWFNKYNFRISRRQYLTERWSLFLSAEMQLANRNLDSSEKLTLGGPYGVRAYPVGEASGDEGWRGTAELRYKIPTDEEDPNAWMVSLFYDCGGIRTAKNPNALAGRNHRFLSGAGLGLTWSYDKQWVARLNYAWKLRDEAAVSDTDRSGRLWFQIYHFF